MIYINVICENEYLKYHQSTEKQNTLTIHYYTIHVELNLYINKKKIKNNQ